MSFKPKVPSAVSNFFKKKQGGGSSRNLGGSSRKVHTPAKKPINLGKHIGTAVEGVNALGTLGAGIGSTWGAYNDYKANQQQQEQA